MAGLIFQKGGRPAPPPTKTPAEMITEIDNLIDKFAVAENKHAESAVAQRAKAIQRYSTTGKAAAMNTLRLCHQLQAASEGACNRQIQLEQLKLKIQDMELHQDSMSAISNGVRSMGMTEDLKTTAQVTMEELDEQLGLIKKIGQEVSSVQMGGVFDEQALAQELEELVHGQGLGDAGGSGGSPLAAAAEAATVSHLPSVPADALPVVAAAVPVKPRPRAQPQFAQ
jgi:hypothetical protein